MFFQHHLIDKYFSVIRCKELDYSLRPSWPGNTNIPNYFSAFLLSYSSTFLFVQLQMSVVFLVDFINRHHIYVYFAQEILSLPNEWIWEFSIFMEKLKFWQNILWLQGTFEHKPGRNWGQSVILWLGADLSSSYEANSERVNLHFSPPGSWEL